MMLSNTSVVHNLHLVVCCCSSLYSNTGIKAVQFVSVVISTWEK